ncbi:MAG: HAMP domain-containing sensor histidine kinase [bacterium]|nr:HAMP domain-containing sensor histidine kinase [bacterium]MDD5757224.1 HAMP domain-containing sensor histidine kinase [bacterium]
MTGEDERDKKIDELNKTIAMLKVNQNQIAQAEKMKIIDEFAHGLSHEVKNPLAIILQGVDYLSTKVNLADPSVNSTVGYMKDAIKRADKVIGDFLNFSSISALELAAVALAEVTDNSLVLVRHQLETHHLEVIKEYQPGLPLVKIDQDKITQVLVNLVLNAVQAVPEGGRITIRISQQQEQLQLNQVKLEIEDNGPGMAEDDLARAFDFFFTTKRSKGNIGLGLSTVKTIIDMHGGEIKLENKHESNGIKITIILKAEQ